MSNPDPRDILFSSRYAYYLNYDSISSSVFIPGTSYTSGTFKSYTLVIPIERTHDATNVKVNFSHIPNAWFDFPTVDIILDANFTIATTGIYASNNLTITFYIVNQSPSTVSNPDLTITASAALSVTPTT